MNRSHSKCDPSRHDHLHNVRQFKKNGHMKLEAKCKVDSSEQV